MRLCPSTALNIGGMSRRPALWDMSLIGRDMATIPSFTELTQLFSTCASGAMLVNPGPTFGDYLLAEIIILQQGHKDRIHSSRLRAMSTPPGRQASISPCQPATQGVPQATLRNLIADLARLETGRHQGRNGTPGRGQSHGQLMVKTKGSRLKRSLGTSSAT